MAVPRPRPTFQSVELDDPIDARLEAKAAEKGIPTLVAPKAEEPPIEEQEPPPPPPVAVAPRKTAKAAAKQPTPPSRMKSLKIMLPDYVWVAVKKRAAEEMVTLRHFIMATLRDNGIPINDADMVEDHRRPKD